MKYRKLRIAWSVGCGIAYLLTLWWWVASYQRVIRWPQPLSNQSTFQVVAYKGSIDVRRWKAAAAGAGVRTPPMRLVVTHSAVAVILAVAILVPWIPWQKRFSLRTLLIATTLVAVALGLIAYAKK